MHNVVGNVFKIIIGTILLAMIITIATALLDCVITVTRIQNITEFIKMDIAQNNCLLNDTYDMFTDELYSISSQSRHLRVCTGKSSTEVNLVPASVADARLNTRYPVELCLSGTASTGTTDWFIQKKLTTGSLESAVQVSASATGGSAPASSTFYVANYGDVLTLHINTVAIMEFWTIPANDGGGTKLSDSGWLSQSVPLTLSYNIPALAYLK